MTEDPWSGMSRPATASALTAKRVDARAPWNFFWAVDREQHCLLMLKHDNHTSPTPRLPRLRGLELSIEAEAAGAGRSLVLRLADSTLRDIFYQLCTDIVAAAADAQSEVEAVALTIGRTWRWHHLLRGGAQGLLSLERQIGLIAELMVLENYLLKAMSPSRALACWRGPLDEPKDFMCGSKAIESKARGSRNASRVHISSEEQLDTAGLGVLFLHLCVLDPADVGADSAFTLSEVVKRVRSRIAGTEEAAVARFDGLLMSAGYSDQDDYSGYAWAGGERGIYQVGPSFPRLVPSGLPSGVDRVQYLLDLSVCSSAVVPPATLQAALVEVAG